MRPRRRCCWGAILWGISALGCLKSSAPATIPPDKIGSAPAAWGINTLAYRLPQNGTFFACDPDCAAHTDRTPWELDRQFLDLVARSGAALFISVDPRTITPEQKAAFRAAMLVALSGGTPGGSEPLDWLHTTAPRVWRFGGERVTYRWEDPAGTSPLRA